MCLCRSAAAAALLLVPAEQHTCRAALSPAFLARLFSSPISTYSIAMLASWCPISCTTSNGCTAAGCRTAYSRHAYKQGKCLCMQGECLCMQPHARVELFANRQHDAHDNLHSSYELQPHNSPCADMKQLFLASADELDQS